MLCYAKKYKNHIRVVKKKGNEGGKNMIEKITKRKSAFTLAEGGRRPLSNLGFGRSAFTLAEVLITLSIIGIVAALTIPSMIENHNTKAWKTAKDLWDKKLVEATRQMNIDGVMTGVANSTEDYMNYFKKYVKVIKTCENDKLSNCYSPKMVLTGGEDVEVSSLTNASALGQKDWGTNTIGFVIADGTTVVMAYNPNCSSVDPFSSEGQNGQVGCMSMMIDVNGKKGPNKIGKDIELKNATISTCDLYLGGLGVCSGGSDIYPTESINTCDGSGNEEWDDRGSDVYNYCATNYWAGAKKACAENGMRLPTTQELADVATYIYKQDTPIGATETRRDISPNATRAAELNWSISNSYASYWSSEPSASWEAYIRNFLSSYSDGRSSDVRVPHRARCFSN